MINCKLFHSFEHFYFSLSHLTIDNNNKQQQKVFISRVQNNFIATLYWQIRFRYHSLFYLYWIETSNIQTKNHAIKVAIKFKSNTKHTKNETFRRSQQLFLKKSDCCRSFYHDSLWHSWSWNKKSFMLRKQRTLLFPLSEYGCLFCHKVSSQTMFDGRWCDLSSKLNPQIHPLLSVDIQQRSLI